MFVPDAGTEDQLYSPFQSASTGNWYVHLSNFHTGGAAAVGSTNLAGTVYYINV